LCCRQGLLASPGLQGNIDGTAEQGAISSAFSGLQVDLVADPRLALAQLHLGHHQLVEERRVHVGVVHRRLGVDDDGGADRVRDGWLCGVRLQ